MTSFRWRSAPHRPPTCARRRAALGAALMVIASSCVTYRDRVSEALRAFEEGDFASAVKLYGDEHVTGSAFLSGTEAGTAALVAGDWKTAQEELGRAEKIVEAYDESPPITPKTTADAAMALLLNESAASYEGEGYERVQLHAMLAMTYLAQGRAEDVAVEARLANKLLENEEKLYEKKYRAGGLGHVVSALAYELQGSDDNAFIDYRRMEQKGVGVELAGHALVRLAQKLGYGQELDELEPKYGAAPNVPADAASIVVIAGIGMGPRKIEKTLTIPLEHGVGQISVPEFVAQPQPINALELRVAGASAPLVTSRIEDVADVARENLDDRIAWLTARSMLRGALKYELTRRLSSELGRKHGQGAELLGVIVGSIVTMATERADLRSWQTLPDSWQAARMFVAPGRHEIALAAVGGESVALGSFELSPGETMFVVARTLGTRIYAHPIGGQRIVDSAPAAPTSTSPTSNTP